MQKVAFMLLPFIFSYCDCVQHGKGFIVDASTLESIDSVKITKIVGKNKLYHRGYYSGKNGSFDLHYISGGMFHCPDLKVLIEKEGYGTIQHNITKDRNPMIKLKRKK